MRRGRPGRQPHRRDPHRGVHRRLEGVRAGGDARSARQLRGGLLHREPRPHGRPHRRLDHRGPGPDPHRRRVPEAARRCLRRAAPGGGGHRRVQRAVRGRSPRRPPGRHRDEPEGEPVLGPGLQGHRVPHRQDGGQAGRRLHARRDPQRHHRKDPGLLRARHRLRGDQDPPVGLREVPRRRRGAGPVHAVGGRGHGHRAHLRRVAAEGPAVAGDGPARAQRRPGRGRPRPPGRRRSAGPGRPAPPGPALLRRGPAAAGRDRRGPGRRHRHRRLVPRPDGADRRGAPPPGGVVTGGAGPRRVAAGQAARLLRRPARLAVGPDRGRGEAGPAGRGGAAHLQDGRHLRGRVRGRHPLPLLHLRGRRRGLGRGAAEGGDPGVGAEPHRPGDRVRLLLRACQPGPAGRRLRDGDGQLQPRDRLHRLRHQRPALLRAPHLRGRVQRDRGRGAGRGDRGPGRADPPGAGRPPPSRAGDGHLAGVHRSGRGPPALERPVRPPGHPPAAGGRGRRPGGGPGGDGPDRLPGPGPPLLRAGGPGHGDRLRRRRPGRGHGRPGFFGCPSLGG